MRQSLLSIRAKLFAGFGFTLLLMVVVGVLGIVEVSAVGNNGDTIGGNSLPSVVDVKTVDGLTMDYRGVQFAHIAAADAKEKVVLADQLRQRAAAVDKTISSYRADLVSNATDAADVAKVKSGWLAYVKKTQGFLALSTANKDQQAKVILDGAIGTYTRMQHDIDAWAALNNGLAAKELTKAHSTKSSATILIIVLLGIAVVLALGIAFLISRGIANGTNQMLRAANGIAEGDVEQDIRVRSRDELGRTATAFQRMVDYLKEMSSAAERLAAGDLTAEIEPKSERDALGKAFAHMARSLRATITEVSGAADALSASSQQMASSSEETGKAVSEIAQAVGDVAMGAERQVKMVERAKASTDETSKTAEQARRKSLPYPAYIDFVAERYHTSPEFLRKLNPGLRIDSLKAGQAA